MTWNNKVTGPWRKASWLPGLDQHHSTSNISIHHPTLRPSHTQARQLAAVVEKQFCNQQKVVFSFNLSLPFQSIEGLGLTFIFLYLQPHIDFSPQERSITNQHEATRRDKSSLEKCLVKTAIFHIKAFKRHTSEGWNNYSAAEQCMALPLSLSLVSSYNICEKSLSRECGCKKNR